MHLTNIQKYATLALTALILWTPHTANAQGTFDFGQDDEEEEARTIWSYDPKFRPEANKPSGDATQGLLSNSNFTMHFIQSGEAGPDEAVLRFSQPVSASGCVTVIPPTIEVMDMGIIRRVIIGTPAIVLDKSVRYAHIDCRQVPNTVQADVVLNRADLLENKVRRISFRNDFGIEDYDLELGEHTLALRAKTRPALFTPNPQIKHKDPLVHYFYPEGTVVLSVPQTNAPQDIYEQVKKLASQRGLIELTSVVKDFRVLNEDSKNFYFVDQSGITTAELTAGQSNRFGKVIVQETYEGPNGEYAEDLALDIYARLPGALD